MKTLSLTVLIALFSLPSTAGEITYVPARDYLSTAEREINAARRTIHLYLYLAAYDKAQPNSQSGRLLQALVRAHQRGVRVDVLFNRATGVDRGETPQNADAAAFLSSQGVPVAFTGGPLLLHAKTLVLDEEVVLMGSTNWSAAAFSRNGEGNVLFRSPEAARAAIKDLGAFPRETSPVPPIPIPLAFLDPASALPGLVTRNDTRGYDVYLYLLRLRSQAGTPKFRVGEKDLTAYLGLHGKDRNEDRTHLLRALYRLRDTHKLIRTEVAAGEDPWVTIDDFPLDTAVNLPEDYFKWGWDKRLSLPAKVFYLLSLHEDAITTGPTWTLSHQALGAQHGLRDTFLMDGVAPLRRAGVLEVRYSPLAQDGSARRPNTYALRPLYDPAEREQLFRSMTEEYGPAPVARAREIAALVYDDNDAQAVEQFILLEQQHGAALMDRALQIIGEKQPTNPRRTTGYLIQTIKGMVAESASGNP